MMRAARIAAAVRPVRAAIDIGALWAMSPMTIPKIAITVQAIAGALLKLSATTAWVAPRPMAATATIHADAERALRATLSRNLHVVTAQSNPKDGTTGWVRGRGACI